MKNPLTFAQLDYLCLHQGNINDQDVQLPDRRIYVNNTTMKLYGALDGINNPFYNVKGVQTVAADQEVLALSGITATTISRGAGIFVAGSIVSVVQWLTAGGGATGAAVLLVTSGGATAHYTLLSGAISLAADTTSEGVVIKSFSQTTIDVSGLYIKDIVAMYDGSGASKRKFYRVRSAEQFNDLLNDPLASDGVYYYWRGDTIDIFVGSSIAALGVITMEYISKPNLFTDATANNSINIPPEQNQMLMDEVEAQYLMHAKAKNPGITIPGDLAGRLENYKAIYDAAAADKQKALGRND